MYNPRVIQCCPSLSSSLILSPGQAIACIIPESSSAALALALVLSLAQAKP